MKFLHEILEKQKPMFEKGGKLEKFYYLFEAGETFLFTPSTVTKNKGVQVRDAIDLKRMMITVVIAMVPALLFGMWNVGNLHYQAIGEAASFMEKFLIGLKVTLPIILVSYAAGGAVEAIFAIMRRHPINEGFLVTGMLVPLVMPPTIPLWQVAFATIFAVLIAKEIFGGTGMNILNVALTARAFLYFAYPQQISGDNVWVYFGDAVAQDGYSGATFLGLAQAAIGSGTDVVDYVAKGSFDFSAMSLFLGTIPGSIGETSTLMCLIGAVILIATGVGSARIIIGTFTGAVLMGLIMNAFGDVNEYMNMPFWYHLIIGGFAFGAVFMATDPVSASHTGTGKWIYGILIGIMTVIIRVWNPAYPEGIMLAILLMNVLAPLIDFYVVQANKNRRLKRATV
ncbi:NADH:ubiquinone reductase (Na(+)-transporting) subunit B [Limibacter armeniacum]|uniref:NADH:ubiquinone reductase (Na(+)-transporting) subunit B n=1 Tax=Limibacter armeniacum TaxID=466084 RepID=UPI002FE52C8F